MSGGGEIRIQKPETRMQNSGSGLSELWFLHSDFCIIREAYD